jgi:hypothetical protein
MALFTTKYSESTKNNFHHYRHQIIRNYRVQQYQLLLSVITGANNGNFYYQGLYKITKTKIPTFALNYVQNYWGQKYKLSLSTIYKITEAKNTNFRHQGLHKITKTKMITFVTKDYIKLLRPKYQLSLSTMYKITKAKNDNFDTARCKDY